MPSRTAAAIQTEINSQHKGSAHLAINNTRARRLLVRLALHTTARFFTRNGTCVPISKHRIVKSGWATHLAEAATMEFVARNTSIPVPKVHCSFLHQDRAYIVMERIQGETLAHAWGRLVKEDSLQKVLLQLKQMVQELRALQPPPGTGVESCVGGSMIDCRLPHGSPRFGPFKTIQEFHRWLRDGFEGPKRSDGLAEEENVGTPFTEQELSALESMVAKQEGSWPPPVFTHCDLNPFNIIVHGDQIVSIIDWEFSGWYPIYWEYTFAWLGNILRSEYRDILQSLMDPYPEKLVMERTRAKWWGEW